MAEVVAGMTSINKVYTFKGGGTDFVAMPYKKVDRNISKYETDRTVPVFKTRDVIRMSPNSAAKSLENAYRMVIRTRNPYVGVVRMLVNPSSVKYSMEKQRTDENTLGGYVSQHHHGSATKVEMEGSTGSQGIAVIRLLQSIIGTSVDSDTKYDKDVEIHYRGEVLVGSFDNFSWSDNAEEVNKYPFSFGFTAFRIVGKRSK